MWQEFGLGGDKGLELELELELEGPVRIRLEGALRKEPTETFKAGEDPVRFAFSRSVDTWSVGWTIIWWQGLGGSCCLSPTDWCVGVRAHAGQHCQRAYWELSRTGS